MTITDQKLLNQALAHHQAGQLAEAEALYNQILVAHPAQPQALYSMGMLFFHKGQYDPAGSFIERAISAHPNNGVYHANLGAVRASQNRWVPAIESFQRATALGQGSADLFANLGFAYLQLNQFLEAQTAYSQSVSLDPNRPTTQANLGICLMKLGRIPEALEAYSKALKLNPDFAEAHVNRAAALIETGDFRGAIEACERALSIQPGLAGAAFNLGIAYFNVEQFDEAIAAYERALKLQPNNPSIRNNLANAYKKIGRYDEAIAAYRAATAIQPDLIEAYNNLGAALIDNGRLKEAVATLRTALSHRPDYVDAYLNLGMALLQQGHLDEARQWYDRAIKVRPNSHNIYSNLGELCLCQCRLDEALDCYRRAIELDPKDTTAHSNRLMALHYHPACDARQIYQEHVHWNQQHAQSLRQFAGHHDNPVDLNRRLKIGYVSGDFRMHSVPQFFLPLLENHDRKQVEVFCYSNALVSDDVTERCRAGADQWREISFMSDARAAELIRRDRIDILVELNGHTSGNRLLVFAQKPSPIQVTWMGYPDTTGLTAIDYRFTDSLADPPGMTDPFCSEQLFRLPVTNWCYRTTYDQSMVVHAIVPNDPVTFACFNNSAKVNDPLLRLWARILRQLPTARLLMKGVALFDESGRRRVIDIFAQGGVSENQLDLRPFRRQDHLNQYNQVGISLDTFPYHGTTTTCEALWMGVPVITLAGSTHVSRVGVSLLTTVGLPELIAHSEEEYVKIAVELAGDLPRLNALRSGLRAKMLSSPLMDAPSFARNVEQAYRTMWHRWCATASSVNGIAGR